MSNYHGWSDYRPLINTCFQAHSYFPSSAIPSWNPWSKVSQKAVQFSLLLSVLQKRIELFCYSFLCFMLLLQKSLRNKKTQTYVYSPFIVLNLKPSLPFNIHQMITSIHDVGNHIYLFHCFNLIYQILELSPNFLIWCPNSLLKELYFHFAYQLSANPNIRSILLETRDRGLQTLILSHNNLYFIFYSYHYLSHFHFLWLSSWHWYLLFILWTSKHSFNCNLIKLLK